MRNDVLWYVLGPILVVVLTALIGLFAWIINSTKDQKAHVDKIKGDVTGLGKRTNDDRTILAQMDKQISLMEQRFSALEKKSESITVLEKEMALLHQRTQQLESKTESSDKLEGEVNLLMYFIQDWIRSKKRE